MRNSNRAAAHALRRTEYPMNKKLITVFAVMAACIAIIASVNLTGGLGLTDHFNPNSSFGKSFGRYLDLSGSAQSQKFNGSELYKAAFEAVRDNHKELADKTARDKWVKEWETKFAKSGELSTEEGTDKAIALMLQSLGQRFDYFMDVDDTKSEKQQVSSSLVGIGITLELKDSEALLKTLPAKATQTDAEALLKVGPGHELTVGEPIEGGPSDKKLEPGDVITKVDGTTISGMLMKDVVTKVRGVEGTTVEITVERTDDKGVKTEHTIKITRAKVVMKVVKTRDLGDGVTYIRLSNFMSENATKEMSDALTAASKGKGIIIDLRNNPGGDLNAVLTMSAYCLPEGTVLTTYSREGNALDMEEVILTKSFMLRTSPNGLTGKRNVGLGGRPALVVPEDMPVIVLINENSASASEILSGVLQYHKRATVVGKASHGKGVGQVVIDLPFGRRLHVTSFEFAPGGKKMDWIGVIPDVEVDQDKSAPKSDKQLDEGLSRIKSQITTKEARDQKAADLEKANRKKFEDEVKKRNAKP